MNRNYRLIFNPCLGVMQVASEVTARTHGGGGAASIGRSRHCPRRLALAVALAMSLPSGAAFAATIVSSTPPQLQGNGMQAFGTVISNAVVIPDGESLTIGGPADGTFSDSISGAGSVVKEGTGTETMTGTNTYTGGTTINAGTLAMGAGGSLAATGAVNLAAPGTGFDISAGGAQSIGVLSGLAGTTVSLGGNTLTLSGVGNGVFDGVIAGTGALVKNGPGIQVLGGANTFSGGMTLDAGGLVLGNNGALSSGSLSVGGNATLDTTTPLNLANAIDLAAGADLDLLGSNALTLGGVISGAGGLIKDGASTLTLTAANTYSGGTTINAGILAIGAGGSLASTGAMNLRGTGVLDISAGGLVESGSGSIDSGVAPDVGVEVTGTDSAGVSSRWTIGTGNLVIGDAGTGRLRIEDGGMVESQNAFIGHGVVDYDEDTIGSSVEVIGSGATWTNAGELLVGENSLATIEVLAGGLVESASVSLGSGTGSEGRIRVSGFDAGGVNSRLGIARNLLVGDAGAGKLLVDNGGVLDNQDGTIGNSADSTDSRALVTGADSAWTNHGTLTVGNKGEGILEVLDGGHVESTLGSIGSAKGSDGKVRVSGVDSAGTRSSWKITLDPFNPDERIVVGDAGSGLLIVEAGGTVGNGQSFIGSQVGSVGKVVVTGPDSGWLTTNAVFVGIFGHGTLLVENGGTVGGRSSAIGGGAGSVGEVTVTGAGSRFMLTSPAIFAIGNSGSGALLVEAGGQASSGMGSIGSLVGSSGQVMVTGAGSRWDNSGQLYVGRAGTGTLTIQKDGVVSNTTGWLGAEGASSSGKVTVTGADSRWINSDDLFVGHIGTGTLLVESGGTVRNQHGFIGNTADSTGSKVTVTGEGSAWTNDGGLWVGNEGSGSLEVLDRGVVGSIEAVVGNVGDGTVLVDGAGSRLDIGGTLAVGNLGSGQVTLSNGGVVTSMYGAIGSQGQEHNTVLVQGAGSSWTGMEDLYVGLEGNAALTIADGGRVEVKAGTLDTDVVLGGYGGSGILNIGTGGAAGVLDAATVTSGEGSATLNFNHDEADYVFTNDGTAGGTAVLIGGTTEVNQIGSGTTVLTGANTYTGATHVKAGTLLVEGSLGKTATSVADGATLGGSGLIAGAVTVADGGILAPGSSAGTLTVGSLSLSAGSTLDYELGQAGTIGGGVNDLIEVTGNLTLDGTLDITDIGGFGAGVYRLINYGGKLTNNGLEIGTRPTGVDPNDLFVQTKYDGQVNLVSTTGLELTFWDGATAPDNDVIDGGSGTWDADNSNWTTADGDMNGRWDNGTFAVFGGAGGTVGVVGEQRIAGVQFMSGYTLATGTDGALSIDNAESVIRVDPNVTATIAAPITGAGGLVKTDTGTLVLSGNNSYLGGTTIRTGTLSVSIDANLGDVHGGLAFDGGTLQTTAAFNSARDVDLQADGGTFLTDTNLDLSGAITGTGTLTKRGTGTLTLTGANSYAGDTRVLEGTLVGDTGSIRGDLANGGNVVFDQADDATFGGNISGAGTITKRGAGVLTLTGNSALDWNIDAGALVANAAQFGGDADIADGARLLFDHTTDVTYAGTIAGAGRFEIAGDDSVFAMTGNSAAFTGTTSLATGTLSLDGMLGGSTQVTHGATLVGTGTLHDLDNHGTIAPGHSIGTLSLSGDYIHHDDATLLAEIAPNGSSDRLDIAGNATLDGGHVQIVKLPGQYTGGTRYTLLDAKGGVTGTFATLDQNLPFLDLQLGYDANHAYLDVQRNDVGFDIACGDSTFNQCQVAGALDRVAEAPAISDDLKSTLAEVSTMDLPNARAAFDRLSGEAHGSLAGILLEDQALQGQTVSRRLAERRDQSGADRLFGGGWARVYGANSNLDGDGNAHGADVEQRGMALGFDTWSNEQWLVGISVNAMSTTADFRPGDRGTADSTGASLYASFDGEDAYLDATAGFTSWRNDVTRRIAVGSIDRTAHSEYGGHRFATRLEGGWTFHVGERQRLQPLVSVEYANLNQDGFRENGAQDLDLIGRAQDVERTTASAGLRWSAAFGHGAWTLEPTVQARWLHAFGDEQAEQDVAFVGAPQIGYRVRGVSWPRDRGLLGVGLHVRQGDTVDLFVDVDYQKSGALTTKNLSAGLRWHW